MLKHYKNIKRGEKEIMREATRDSCRPPTFNKSFFFGEDWCSSDPQDIRLKNFHLISSKWLGD